MRSFDELLADFLEEPEEVLSVLNDLVTRGRMQADTLDGEALQILGQYDMTAYLITRSAGRPVRTWVYPSPLGLRMYALLEREAEREAEREQARQRTKPRNGRRSGKHRA